MDKKENEDLTAVSGSSSFTTEDVSSKPRQKNRGRKRKRRSSSSENELSLPDNTLETERNVHASAIKNNLDDSSVRKILKKVITNDHVLALVKLKEEEEGDSGSDDKNVQPKLTRAKANMDTFLKNNITSVSSEVQQQTRIVINNVLTFLSELKDPQNLREVNFQKPRDLTALVCGVSLRTVDRIKQECKGGGEARVPRKNVHQARPVTDMDDFNIGVIKEIVTSFHLKGENPSAQRILDVAKERIEGFKCSNTSMRRILKELGYKFRTAPDGMDA